MLSLEPWQVSSIEIGIDGAVFQSYAKAGEQLPMPWRCVTIRAAERTFNCAFQSDEHVVIWVRAVMSLVCMRSRADPPSIEAIKENMRQVKAAANLTTR